jgi:alpha-tubulin suppressor-like RCC1 family protein
MLGAKCGLGRLLVALVSLLPLAAGAAPLPPIKAIAAKESFSLALAQDGTVWAWGTNQQGVLGDGTTERRLTPVRVGP